MSSLIKVFYSNANGEIVSQSYSAETFTVDTAEQSMRDHGFTVLYSSIHS